MNNLEPQKYYVPEQSPWPIVGSVALFLIAIGFANTLHHNFIGPYLFIGGIVLLLFMLSNWFGNVINENLQGLYNAQLDRSFRLGMFWFIVSEVFFFMAFFGALFYVRFFVLHWLAGESETKSMTGILLWPNHVPVWPLLHNPSPKIPGPSAVINPWGLPLINTIILLSSSVTITLAHHALKAMENKKVLVWTAITVILGIAFIFLQAHEYIEAYQHLGLTLGSGIYGTTFFMLTGFHGLHVTLGTIMIAVMLIRAYKGHFTPKRHFGFEAAAWYWHFVDVVWIGLFIFVYCL